MVKGQGVRLEFWNLGLTSNISDQSIPQLLERLEADLLQEVTVVLQWT